jgi:metal-responsive CopG/Arc/MetJ family transcriptional regulator
VPKDGYRDVSLKEELIKKIDKIAKQDPADPSRAQVIATAVDYYRKHVGVEA